MHSWGEEGVDWKGISDAAVFIGTYLKRYGRINVTTMKEKWGTVRVYCSFGWHQFHSITHPGYVYSRYPKWLWKLDCLYSPYLFQFINRLVVPLHLKLYKRAYKLALKKWPHLAQEIIMGSDFAELLTDIDSRLVIENKDGCNYISWNEQK